MNGKTIIKYFNGLEQDTLITIHKGTYEPLEVIKRDISYTVENKTLIILDTFHSNLHLINLGSIRDIKFNGIKFGANDWLIKANEMIIKEVSV